MRASSIVAASVALVAGANAHYSYDNVTYTTEVVTAYTTVCPSPTEIVHGTQTYTVTEATTLTITNCPCTLTKPVYTAPVLYCTTLYTGLLFRRSERVYANYENSHSSTYIPSTVVYTTPVATIASSSPIPYTSTIPVPYTSNEVVYTSSVPVVSTRTSIISIKVSTSVVQIPTSAVEVPSSVIEVPTSRGPVATIPVYRNATSTYVAPPAGTATGGAPGGAPAATTSSKAFLGAANKAYTASGASLAALLGLAAILL